MSNEQYSHKPVLFEACIDGLNIKPSGRYLDGTFGRGGHSRGILEKLDQDGELWVVDRDPEALAVADALAAEDSRVKVCRGSFADLAEMIDLDQYGASFDGVLFDFGVSSPQLDDARRGFSFLRDGPLDMRMDPTSGISAAEWLNTAAPADIAAIFHRYGEERYTRRIVDAIIEQREEEPLETTKQLAKLVDLAVPKRSRQIGKHPATRVFQATRIFINDELGAIETMLPATLKLLVPQGRLVIISFHSLEDRIIKRFIRDQERGKQLPRDLPVMHKDTEGTLKALGKAIKGSAEDALENSRARSAVLRIAERTGI
ncbi:16S rRNA (cytosine(1402)-N(4))-methyltransferase [Pelagibaculum spongiae]|uniref:Ribosomal RNA small subunit methyltransferase H n=1 Tax=Pelagibaculum spongiae TaxID=2080658 RepID=A0A2V1GZL5_9GAMM|nr:16S rRNA (cytosine(1402)-N(4))-methyltransferase RsmH [Pelagibaculum spongiae]PVZ71879.1 16S rRNA (cytosine(1402)-N(4))-methyltransferase [Pelagibaculum spongiae]